VVSNLTINELALPSFNSHRSTFIIDPSGKAHTKATHTQQVRHFVLKEHPKSDKSSIYDSIQSVLYSHETQKELIPWNQPFE